MSFTPKDWHDLPTTDTPLSAAAIEDLETRVTDYADSLVLPTIRCCVIRTSALTVPTSTGTMIPWQSDSGTRCYNTNSQGGSNPWSATHDTRFTAPIAGAYSLSCSFNYDDDAVLGNGAAGAGERDMEFQYNGVSGALIATINHDCDATNGRFLHMSEPYIVMSANDYIEIGAYQDSGQDRTIQADGYDAEDFNVCRATFALVAL